MMIMERHGRSDVYSTRSALSLSVVGVDMHLKTTCMAWFDPGTSRDIICCFDGFLVNRAICVNGECSIFCLLIIILRNEVCTDMLARLAKEISNDILALLIVNYIGYHFLCWRNKKQCFPNIVKLTLTEMIFPWRLTVAKNVASELLEDLSEPMPRHINDRMVLTTCRPPSAVLARLCVVFNLFLQIYN